MDYPLLSYPFECTVYVSVQNFVHGRNSVGTAPKPYLENKEKLRMNVDRKLFKNYPVITICATVCIRL